MSHLYFISCCSTFKIHVECLDGYHSLYEWLKLYNLEEILVGWIYIKFAFTNQKNEYRIQLVELNSEWALDIWNVDSFYLPACEFSSFFFGGLG